MDVEDVAASLKSTLTYRCTSAGDGAAATDAKFGPCLQWMLSGLSAASAMVVVVLSEKAPSIRAVRAPRAQPALREVCPTGIGCKGSTPSGKSSAGARFGFNVSGYCFTK